MKNLKIAGILILCGVAICLCVLLGISLAFGGRERPGGRREYVKVQEWEMPADDIRSLKVNTSFPSIYFCEGTGDKILIREYTNFTPKEGQLSRVAKEGTDLQIRGPSTPIFTFFFWGFRDSYMEIYLPAGLAEKLDVLNVETTSGDVIASIPLRVSKISISTTSGDIVLDQVEGDTIMSSTSGDISLESLTGNGVFSSTSGEIMVNDLTGDSDISTTSGDILLGQVEGGMEFSTTSGSISIRNGKGHFRANTTSGDILLDLWDGAIFASTTSGDVELKLPRKGSFSLDFDTVSGECDTFFNDDLSFSKDGRQVSGQYGGGKNDIEVSTTSGDLWIGSD